MIKIQISKARQSQLAAAFRAGLKCACQNQNPYADSNGGMPTPLASVRGAQWHAFDAGCLRARGSVSGAGTMLRNARLCMLRATEMGRA